MFCSWLNKVYKTYTLFGLFVFLNYPCTPSPTITPANREYTVLQTTNETVALNWRFS
jgi:hypothetical protein